MRQHVRVVGQPVVIRPALPANGRFLGSMGNVATGTLSATHPDVLFFIFPTLPESAARANLT
jgi:hypothetical protein